MSQSVIIPVGVRHAGVRTPVRERIMGRGGMERRGAYSDTGFDRVRVSPLEE